MTKSEHAALIRSLLSMQRRCDAIAERLGGDYSGDPETDPATAVHCVSAALETAMSAVDYAREAPGPADERAYMVAPVNPDADPGIDWDALIAEHRANMRNG